LAQRPGPRTGIKSGKWRWAICVSGKRAAPNPGEPVGVGRPSSQHSFSDVYTACNKSQFIDLYAVGDKDNTWETLKQKEAPFMHWLLLHGPQGEKVRVEALFDGGAMVGAMCTSFFKKVQHRLHGQTKPSS